MIDLADLLPRSVLRNTNIGFSFAGSQRAVLMEISFGHPFLRPPPERPPLKNSLRWRAGEHKKKSGFFPNLPAD
jgi:hypothetical protein